MLFPRIGIYVLSGKITIVTLPQTGLSKTVIRMLGRCSAGFSRMGAVFIQYGGETYVVALFA